jgi:hypothetical protein
MPTAIPMKAYNTIRLIIGCMLALFFYQYTSAQAPVQAFSATYMNATTGVSAYTATPATNSGSFTDCVTQNSTYTFDNGTTNVLRLTDIIASGKNFYVANSTLALIKLRRVNNPVVTGTRSIIFLESTLATTVNCPGNKQYNFKSPYQDNMETFLNNNYINQGTDNIFANTGNGDGNNNNIERVDVIFPAGVASASAVDAGFVLFDRGNNNAHDAFRIAAITGIDAANNPTSFGPVRTCIGGNGSNNGNWGHPSLANGNRNLAVYVMRKESYETRLRSSAAINQQLGAVFFSLASLGVSANQKIYGYALLSNDGKPNPSSAELLNITNTTIYPTNTTEQDGGGLDLIAVNAFFQTGPVLNDQITELKANWQGEKAILQWQLKEWPVGSKVELQGSADGAAFSTIHSFHLTTIYNAGSFTDSDPGHSYYRLQIEAPGIAPVYSATIQVSGEYRSIQLYPSRIQPAQSVNIKGLSDGTYTAVLTAASGTIYVSTVKVQSGKGLIHPPVAGFAKGFYYVAIRSAHGQTEAGSKLVVY